MGWGGLVGVEGGGWGWWVVERRGGGEFLNKCRVLSLVSTYYDTVPLCIIMSLYLNGYHLLLARNETKSIEPIADMLCVSSY